MLSPPPACRGKPSLTHKHRSVGKWGNDPTKGNYRRALTARKRVHKLRVADAHTEFCDTLRNKFDKEHEKPKNRDGSEPYREGLVQENNEERLPNGLRVLDCSVKEAAERIRAAGNPDFSLNRLYKSWKKARKQGKTEREKNRHELNIQVIRGIRAWMLPGKCEEEEG